jgi:glycine reductase complex component B subunit gamma
LENIRVLHYLNQFFAGIGGEDKADEPVGFRQGALGPGKRLQQLLGSSIEIVTTVYCGDNYFAQNRDEALSQIRKIAKDSDVKIVIAGPAFQAGRYGFACTEVMHSLSNTLGLYCVSGMEVENPAVVAYQKYRDMKVFILPASDSVKTMGETLSRMAIFVVKLASGAKMGPAPEEGYIPRGVRVMEIVEKKGTVRAVDMLLNKLANRPFTTEIPIQKLEVVPVPAPIVNLKKAHIAIVSTAGVVQKGNPDGFKVARNTQCKKYSFENLKSMTDTKWEVHHFGYDNTFMIQNPNYGVPLDVCREMEKEGVFAKLYPYFYTTVGTNASILAMQKGGNEIAAEFKRNKVDAVLLIST